MFKKIRVAFLDDHQGIIDGYHFRLSNHPNIEIVAETYYGEALGALLKTYPIDLLILDVNVPTSENNINPYPILHLIPKLLQEYPKLRILAISQHSERALVKAVLDSGASGYILKDDYAAIRKLAEIIERIVREGGAFVSESLEQSKDKSGLTKTQREILSYLAAYPDMTLRGVGQQLGLAYPTVRNSLTDAYTRLNVTNKTAAIVVAREQGLLTPFESSPNIESLRRNDSEEFEPAE